MLLGGDRLPCSLLDDLFREQSRESDPQKRSELIKKFQLEFLKTYYQVNLAWVGYGAAHLNTRPPHPLLLARLTEFPGDLIVRSELEQETRQRPALRPLLEVVQELDALCVVPLVVEGQLEGALLVPRAERKAPTRSSRAAPANRRQYERIGT